MAKGKSPLLVGGIVGVLLLGGLIAGAVVISSQPGAGGAAQPTLDAPKMPEGKLLFLSSSLSEARYLSLADLRREGDVAQATVLIMGKSEKAIPGGYAMLVKRETVDCKHRTIANEQGSFFNMAGQQVTAKFLSAQTGREFDGDDEEAPRICAGDGALKGRTIADYQVAQRENQIPPESVEAAVDADPKDAHGAAWLCANAAHGRWRDAAPRDCDRAVALLPASVDVLIDRGVLRTKTGAWAGAKADFDKAIAMDPTSAAAFFGRAIFHSMRGNKAASLADKDAALALDPKVPDWIQATYGFSIPAEWRS